MKYVSSATVNRTVIEPLQRIFKRAAERWNEPVQLIVWRDHKLKEPKERIRFLSFEEQARLLKTLPDQYVPITLFAIASGFRANECVKLRWKDVDWTAECMRVVGKGNKVGTIPLSNQLRELLTPLGVDGRLTEQVFQGRNEPIRYAPWYQAFKAACRKADVADMRLHDLRHTAATRLVKETGNLQLAQRLLRHEDISTTARYSHMLASELKQGMEKVRTDYITKVPP